MSLLWLIVLVLVIALVVYLVMNTRKGPRV